MAAKMAAEAVPDPGRPIYLEEARIRTEAALGAEIGFVERLVWFWSNHFCVSADKIRSMSGAYEREAIRPHVLGRFTDLLLAAEGHPAMLFYLDQTVSMGANSTAGINRSRGLNENLAREILELHTLGVRTGYTQDDVIGFANVLTGWTLVPPGDNPEHGGEFTFNPRLHEPGAQKVLGKSYDDETVEQGRAVLRDLAAQSGDRNACRHQAGALFHRRRAAAGAGGADGEGLSRYRRRSQAGRQGDGLVRRSVDAAAGQTQAARASGCVGMVRATGLTQADPARYTDGQVLLGEPLWRPPSPKGFPDDEASWIDGMGRRLDVANNFAERVAGTDRSAGGHRDRARVAGVARGEAGGRPRREPSAGAGAVVHVGRIPEEVSMTFRHHLPTPPRGADRRRQPVRVEPDAEARTRRGPRSAHARHRAARRARWSRCGRPRRRSRLDRPARRPRAACSTASRRRCRSTASSRSIPRCRTCTGSTRRSRRPSCTPPRRPIASARISTARTCSKAASRGRAPSTPAGSTARWPNWRRTAGSIRAAAASLASAP